MSKIQENLTLEMDNVLTFRGEVTDFEAQKMVGEMKKFADEQKLTATGNIVTTTHAIRDAGLERKVDFEILMPVDRIIEIPKTEKFFFKPKFRLYNAMKITHHGSPMMVQNTADELLAYMQHNNYVPITTMYNIPIEANSNDVIIDMYIGISTNIL